MRQPRSLYALLFVLVLLVCIGCSRDDGTDGPTVTIPSDASVPADDQPVMPATLPGPASEELPIYDQQQIAAYYDALSLNDAMLNPVFAYPGESAADDLRNLFVFGLRMAQWSGDGSDSVPKAVFDSHLQLHFDRTLASYDAPEGRIEGDMVHPGEIAADGLNRFVLTGLSTQPDGTKKGEFLVYHFPKGTEADLARLRQGYVGDYAEYYSCTAVIHFDELMDKERMNLRFLSIVLEE